MNRRDRRAAAALGQPSSEASRQDPGRPGVSTRINVVAARGAGANGPPVKPSWVLRLVARVLLSRWLLARVKNPEVERLLISVAMEAGRPEIADELIRRQTLRAR
jgi:hypothetical protein